MKVTALGGESFFVNDYVAHGDCSIGLTGPPLGDIVHLDAKPSPAVALSCSQAHT